MKSNNILRYMFYRYIFFHRRKNKKFIKKKNWNTELPIFRIKMNKIIFILNHAKSPDTIEKCFDSIPQLVLNLQLYRTWFTPKLSMEILGYDILIIENIKILKNKFMKNFILNRMDIEIKKSEGVTTKWIKEKYIRKAIDMALNSLEYLSEDQEMLCRIAGLESLLTKGAENE